MVAVVVYGPGDCLVVVLYEDTQSPTEYLQPSIPQAFVKALASASSYVLSAYCWRQAFSLASAD